MNKTIVWIVILVLIGGGALAYNMRDKAPEGGSYTAEEVVPTEEENTSAPKEEVKPVTETKKTETTPTKTSTGGSVVAGENSTQKTFTLADLATHSDRTSCYTTINGSVYDLTNYIDRHPGGASKILRICGKDGTSLFEDQHGGQQKPEQILASLKVGVLAK